MTFLIALTALFLALLAGTAIECPRLCSEAGGGIGVSQAVLVLSPPCCWRTQPAECVAIGLFMHI